MAAKYPNVKVKLSGTDGNAFSILGRVTRAMRKAKIDELEIEEFRDDAMSGDYNHLLATCSKWVAVS